MILKFTGRVKNILTGSISVTVRLYYWYQCKVMSASVLRRVIINNTVVVVSAAAKNRTQLVRLGLLPSC